ncbi:MAG TPA: tyrosine-type recombinase/integrase [Burkholderiales bacterium]|nr:tyrosine-type recombinase/integrase [Burkholderiales bacterium]
MGRAIWMPVVSGPLAPYASALEHWLTSRGYARGTIGHKLWQLDQLSCWLERQGITAVELTPERVDEFLRARRAAGRVSFVTGGELPLGYLVEAGLLSSPTPVAAEGGPLEELLAGYRSYLLCERGVREQTVVRYEPDVRLFLAGRDGPSGLGQLSASDVSSFLARECPRRSIAGARHLVKVLRSLLRYLHLAGLIPAPLQWAVPAVADLRGRSLPRGLDSTALARLLGSCDRRRTIGRRDAAILLLLARLGLRASEVAGLRLDDVDWRAAEVLIRGKGGRSDRLPLSAEIGEALVSYLRRRPRCESRALFLRTSAPREAIGRSAVSMVVRAACARAGLPPMCAHRLRHTAATQMMRGGASLKEIGEVLRHSQVQTTAIYARVDREALRALAQPWPGGAT